MRFWWAEVDSNHRSRRRQIYSLIHLATLESAHIYLIIVVSLWSRWLDSNPQPADYKSAALPIELHRHLVPWGGIEPPTGRFSVCCSTDWATKAFMATQNGLEPSTSSVTGWRSNQLSYWAITVCTQTVLVYNNLFRNFCQAFFSSFFNFFWTFFSFVFLSSTHKK